MRSLSTFGASNEMSLLAAGSGHRPDALRRAALGANARLLMALTALALPVAVYALVLGLALPFIVAVTWFAGGAAAAVLHREGHAEAAAGVEVGVLMAGGGLLALADPAPADFGLAVAVLGPVLASLVGGARLRRLSWIGFGLIFAAAMAPLWLERIAPAADPYVATLTGSIAFLAAAVVVAHCAGCISLAYEVYDRAQVAAYRHLVEHVQDAVLRFSEAGAVLFASHSAEALFGCRRYELNGAGLGERVHVADRPAYLTALADATRAGQARRIEVRLRRDDPAPGARLPRYFWAEISFSPVPDPARPGPEREVVALFRDITRRKDEEAEMQAARRAAEEASDAKSRFLATMGHELRTPLNAVVGFSEMMMQGMGGELSETHRDYAGLIHQSGKHLLEVVGMLLDMSRIEAGKFELQAEMLAPEALIGPSFQMVEALARQRNVTLRTEIAYPLPSLVADERACRQILINLISNAVKFSHEGGAVTVSLKRQGQCLNLSVRDTGIGMDAAAVERIGEPFFQASGGLDRRHEGTGLGLSIVKGLVQLHGGALRCVSEVGAGTTMTVLLPLNGPSTKTGETASAAEPPRTSVSDRPTRWHDEKRKAL